MLTLLGYRGGRVRCSAEVRADGITEWSGLWMRVGGKEQGAVVLDVPSEGERLAFGLLLQGRGAVQLAGVRLQPVGVDVAVTGASLPGGWTLDGSARSAYELAVEERGAPDQASSAVGKMPARPGRHLNLIEILTIG